MIKIVSPSFVNRYSDLFSRLSRYRFIALIVFIGIIYGFILMRIGALSNVEPTADAVQSQVQAARVPHIPEATIKQLESLEDNSVNVQSLFDEARSTPFQ